MTEAKRKRSRFGCHRCKRLKVKCDEAKPKCSLCSKGNKECDYSIKLQWGGRPFKKQKQNNLALGTVVAFDQKYNPEKQTDLSTRENTPLERARAMEMSTSTSTSTSYSNSNSESPPQISSQLQIIPELQQISKQQEPEYLPLDDTAPTTPYISQEDQIASNAQELIVQEPQRYENLMFAFKHLETSNTLAKNFVNDVLLPDFTELHDYTKLDDADEDSSPENINILISENSHTFNKIKTPENIMSPFSDFLTDPLKLFTGFETIPETISPLPDLLRNNPLYKRHYHSYIEVFSKMLCPAPPHRYTDNPFTCILPKMSLSSGTDGLLSVLIALAMGQTNTLRDDEPYPKEAVKELLGNALNDLYNKLTDPVESESDYTLALILVISCFELFSGTHQRDWRAHYFGAKKIMLSRGFLKAANNQKQMTSTSNSISLKNNKSSIALKKAAESDLTFFFTRWFAYLDVIGALSSSSALMASTSINALSWEGPMTTVNERAKLQDIDPFMGFDLRLLEYLCTIISLVKERENLYTTADSLSVTIIQQALEAKERLLKYLNETESERDEIKAQITADPINVLNDSIQDYGVLRATNKIFALSGVLQIYRRVLMMPRESQLVQDIITEITDIFQSKISKNQPAAYCTVFSLFSVGSDVIDDEVRNFYHERVLFLKSNGIRSAQIALEVMEESWCTNKYWADILAERDIGIVFI